MIAKTVSIIGRVFQGIFLLLFIFGVFLILLNIASLVVPYRSPDVYSYYKDDRKDAVLTYEQTMAQIHRLPGESDEEYVPRLASVISKSISPYWTEEEIDRFRVRVPIWENYILWAHSFINPKTYLRYEYYDYERALERGVGLCSQYAIVASQILEENGIETKIIGLSGHVLTTVEINDKWHVVDPEYDVVMPFSLEELEKRPDIVEEYYKKTWAPPVVPELFATAENNKVIENAYDYKGVRTVQFEQWAYQAVWFIPLGFIAPYTVLWSVVLLYQRRKSNKFALDQRINQMLGENQLKK